MANTAWLLGGKGFGAVCSLFYLAILSRSLGLKDFGHFSLIFGTGQALVAIAGFQTWQAVVRYGAPYVQYGDWERFGRLSILCGLLDAAGAVAGCLIAFVVFYGFAGALDLNPAYIDIGFAFCCALLWARVSAPSGILRALDRFDKAVYIEAVVPTGRLIAGTLIWLTGASVMRFLFAWAAIDLLCAMLYWWVALRQLPHGVGWTVLGKGRQTLRENPGIERFLMIVSAGSTVDAAYKQGPLLAVGYFLGTSTAGLYRLADQLAQGFGKVATLLTRAVYSEISRARVSATLEEFSKLVRRISKTVGVAGASVVGLTLLAGKQLLALIGGHDFAQGAIILVPLAIAASFDLASVAFEPVLHATGRARLALMARLLAVLALGLGLWVLIGIGPSGVAWAVALGGTVSYLAMAIMAYVTLRRVAHEEQAGTTSTADRGELS